MSNITKNIIYKFFHDFAANHLQIQDFGYGDLSELSASESLQYPIMWVNPLPVTISGNEVTYKYALIFADRVLDGDTNLVEVESDTLQYSMDALAAIANNNIFDWNIEQNATAEPFNDRWHDRVAGNVLTVAFTTTFDYSECNIPYITPTAPPEGSDVAVVTINTVYYASLLPGSTTDITVQDENGNEVGSLIDGIWVVPNSGSANEVDPIFTNSPAYNITQNDIDNWNDTVLCCDQASANFVPQTRTIDINGVSYDLSADREWHTGYADTGVLDFAGISIVSSTQVDVGALTGIITDNETDPNNPTHTHVSYAGGTNITVPTIASGIISYLLIDDTNTLVWQNTYPTSAERKSMIFLGKVSHPDLTSLLLSFDNPDYIISPVSSLRDLYQVFNYINDNVYPYPNNTNLQFATTSGNIHGNGINYTSNNAVPNEISYSGVTTTNFRYVTQDGTLGSVVSNIVPGSYDVGGTVTAIPGANSRATIQYIFAVPSNSGISFIIQYGQTWYTSLANAVAAVGKENFVICPGLESCGILIGVIVLRKDTTDLTNDTQAHIFKADKLGQIIGAQSGVSTATLQKAYDNSEIPQITVNPTLGALTIKSGMVANTDNIEVWQNLSGTNVAYMTGNGRLGISGLTLTLGSDATGDIFYRNSSGNFARLGVGSNGQVLTLSGGLPSWATPNAGTVTSVNMSVPTGFAISGNPITSSGTLALVFDTGYSLPTNASQTNWNTAYGWGDHASAGYLLASTAATTYQPLDGDLTAIAALSGTSGLLRKTAANTWSLDTTAYIDNTVTSLSSLTTVGTLTSGTLSTGFVVAGVTMTLGSDATGDIYYRNSVGVLTRLGVGSNGDVLTLASGLPSWAAPSGGSGSLTVGTSAISSGTAGRILFEGTGNVLQESANLLWDETNSRLSVGGSPASATVVTFTGTGSTSSTNSFRAHNAAGTSGMYVRDDGAVYFIAPGSTQAITNGYGAFYELKSANTAGAIHLGNSTWKDGNGNFAFVAQASKGWLGRKTLIEVSNTVGTPDASAVLELKSTSLGFLPPRMTGTQAEAISSPATGLMVYSTDGSGSTITSAGWWGYDGSTWVKLN